MGRELPKPGGHYHHHMVLSQKAAISCRVLRRLLWLSPWLVSYLRRTASREALPRLPG